MLSKQDWTLLVISSAKGAMLSPVQLQKALFLIGQNAPSACRPEFYEFVPYNYGPFCAEIYCDADNLALADEIVIEQPPGQRWPQYEATTSGHERAAAIREGMPKEVCTFFDHLVDWISHISFPDLLRTIYKHYPDFAAKSVFRG